MERIGHGFPPVCFPDSKVLILGSFPSVKSRKINFFYGNPQNRFWSTVCSFFGEEIPSGNQGKTEFCQKYGIALYDVIEECDVQGSADSSIQNVVPAAIPDLIKNSRVTHVLLNGTLAFKLYEKYFAGLGVPYFKLSSTSPANPRFSKEEWYAHLSNIFGRVE